jgi:hypothetical protein
MKTVIGLFLGMYVLVGVPVMRGQECVGQSCLCTSCLSVTLQDSGNATLVAGANCPGSAVVPSSIPYSVSVSISGSCPIYIGSRSDGSFIYEMNACSSSGTVLTSGFCSLGYSSAGQFGGEWCTDGQATGSACAEGYAYDITIQLPLVFLGTKYTFARLFSTPACTCISNSSSCKPSLVP